MKKRNAGQMYLAAIFASLAFSGFAFAEIAPDTETKQGDAMSPKESISRAVKKSYAGGTVGFGVLNGWSRTPVDDYYNSINYYHDHANGWLNIGDYIYQEYWKTLMTEGKIFVGYRLLSFMDVELGYSRNDSHYKDTYKRYGRADVVWSERRIKVNAQYFSALFRAPTDRYVHGLYVRLGRHASRLEISKAVTGSPANLNTIAAGDHLLGDGISKGAGSLVGLGFDFRTGRVGAVRLEYSRYYNLGGTSIGKTSLGVGYLGNF